MLTLEDPWRLVNKAYSQTLWVMCLEAFDHEFDRRVVLCQLIRGH